MAHPKVSQRLTAYIVHDYVARALVLHEVVDAHDVLMHDFGEELLLGGGSGHRRFVARVEQPLQNPPRVLEHLVLGEVDPSEAAMGQTPRDQITAFDEVADLEFGPEGIGRATVRAKSLRPGGAGAACTTDFVIAPSAEPLFLGHLRVCENDFL